MLKKFLFLEWKSFTRSASFKVNLLVKIILGIVIAFYGAMILALGVLAFYGLRDSDLEPLQTVNQFLIYWWAGDLVIRYFMQQVPTMWVRPMLTMPISKKTLTNYLLGKSSFSFFNLYPSLFLVPFSIALLWNGYSILGVIGWHLALFCLTFFNNFLNLAVNNKDWLFVALAVILGGFGYAQYQEIYDITVYFGAVFQSFYTYPFLFLIPAVMLYLIYRYSFKYYRHSLYLDDILKIKNSKIDRNEYGWLNRFGIVGNFMKNDLRLILRNKRAKSTIWTSLFFLFYGFFIYTNPSMRESSGWLILSGIFISGGFQFTFGGFVPSWDSSYYPLMMSQNIRYKEYLTSKWWLIVTATVISMILASFYLFVDAQYYWAVLAGGIYNIGVNSYITLLSGAFTKTPIDLTSAKNLFGNKKAFNFRTVLLTLPQIIFPIGIFAIFNFIYSPTIGFIAVAATGVVGLIFRNFVFSLIAKTYKEEKYETLDAYKQKQ